MNIHDRAHELAKVLQNSQEYQTLLATQSALSTDEAAKKMVKEFLTKKMEAEYEIMAGKPEDKAKTEKLQKMYELLAINTRARDFLHAQIRFQQVMGDVYKIMSDAVTEGMSIFADEQ
ncbi:MAG TPA: YlbF family regulator [Patescibacteria group bacterium]|nr:YlbF family regulator [Patescibacteria group bacterium]